MACIGRAVVVGRLEADPVLAPGGRSCSLSLATGRTGEQAERHVVHVTGEAAVRCVQLRRGARVAVEGRTIGANRLVASRVRDLR